MPAVTGPTSLNRSVLGVLDVDGVRGGVGFLIAPDLALTCAHVVDQAASDGEADPGAPVTLDLPLVPASRSENGIRSVRAVVERWQPPADDGSGDIAVLRLQETLAESQPVRMVEAADVWGHLMRAFGFPVGRDFGIWHAGRRCWYDTEIDLEQGQDHPTPEHTVRSPRPDRRQGFARQHPRLQGSEVARSADPPLTGCRTRVPP